MTAARTVVGVAALSLGLACAGCSLINSFADLVPAPVEADAGPRGVVVVGGAIEATDGGPETFVLTALDPTTGAELPRARTPMKVAAVAYDPPRDLWYVFESGGQSVFALPGDTYFLHVERLDPVTGAWTELGRLQVPPGLSFSTTAVLGERVSYVAYGQSSTIEADGGAEDLMLLTVDTSNPASMMLQMPVALASEPAALVGTPSSVNPAGGFLTLGETNRTVTPPVAQLTPVLVPANDPPALEAIILGTSPAGGLTGFGAASVGGTTDVVAITHPFDDPTAPATLTIYDPTANDPSQALVAAGQFPFGDDAVKPPAFSACAQVAFVVGTNVDLSLYAVSVAGAGRPETDGGAPMLPYVSTQTGHSGQGVYFEPYTSTVLVPFSQGDNYALTAFTFSGASGALQLTERTSSTWTPPASLRPNFVATRGPAPSVCPSP